MSRGQSSLPVALLVLSLFVLIGLAALAGSPLANVLTDPPRVSLETTQALDAGPDESRAAVVFTHDGGNAIPADGVVVIVDGERAVNRANLTVGRSASTFDLGERIVLEQTAPGGLTGGERVVLVYQRGGTQFELRTVTVAGAEAGD
jgi:hypothetical protein